LIIDDLRFGADDDVQTTAEIIAAVLQGQRALYAELVRRHQRMALATAWRVLGDFHAAEDAVQEAFVSAYRHLADLKDRDSFAGWMLAMVRREAIRIAQRRRQVLPPDESAATDVENPGERAEEMRLLLDAVERLPEHERVVVVLHYLEDHDVQTIAAMTGRPLGTVTKQLSRAVQRLRHMFSEIKP
jgi:RNA polymerase sigma-70 factor, ECF subfamily